MAKRTESAAKAIEQLLAPLRASDQETEALKRLEGSGNTAEFAAALRALDNKEALRGVTLLERVDKKLINRDAYRAIASTDVATITAARARAVTPSMISTLIAKKDLLCECMVPFKFESLRAFDAMSGPDLDDVRQGILGAIQTAVGEYTVTNPGTPQGAGKTRVHLLGEIHLSFSAKLPQTGRYCLLMPSGPFWVHGHSRVVGQGNWTTSYDAKVWVDFFTALAAGGTLVEFSGEEIYHDGTRSEDRQKLYNHDLDLPSRVVFFNANANDDLRLEFQLNVDTAANEDGVAIVVVEAFGFPANTKHDYDTFVIRTE